MDKLKHCNPVEVFSEEDFEKAVHPKVIKRLELEGFADFTSNESSYFIMKNEREFVTPPRAASPTKKEISIGGSTEVIAFKSHETICYASGICENRITDNNTVLCRDCVKLFIRNGLFVVDLMETAKCDDCDSKGRSIRVHCSNRQLCISCFKISLERVRQKREEKLTGQRIFMGVNGLFSMVTGKCKP